MNETNYTCVNCQTQFHNEEQYKLHYKSEHHRYNVKRKLINLPPLPLHDYNAQFASELSSKSQSTTEIHCEVCCKKFMSPQTYKQHINSHKHKLNRKALLNHEDKSENSSLSEFELITDTYAKQTCPFCPAPLSDPHLANAHAFPPFKHECQNLPGLLAALKQTVSQGKCVFCQSKFGSEDSAKQHMQDTGHGKLDLENFGPFEQFYLWKISESDEDEEVEVLAEGAEESDFSVLSQETLQSLQAKRLGRVKYGLTGVTINGKEVGYRAYRHFYRQNLTRPPPPPREDLRAIAQEDLPVCCVQTRPKFERIVGSHNHR